MKKIAWFAVGALSVALRAAGAESITLGSREAYDWMVQPVASALAAPGDGQWRHGSCIEYLRRTDCNPKQGLPKIGEDDMVKFPGVWKVREVFVPPEWRGGFVRFVQNGLHEEDLLLWVNGEKAGEILRPAGAIEVSKWIRPGETNELRVYLSQTGEGTSRGKTAVPHWWQPWNMGPFEPCRLEMTRGAYLSDIFANTSWRKHHIDFEATVSAPAAEIDTPVGHKLTIEVFDAAGNRVMKLGKKVAVAPGENVFTLGGEWADPHCWELGRGYLYRCRATLAPETGWFASGGRKAAALARRDEKEFRFGFREIWRDGKELMMNGHRLHFRPCYSYGVNRWGARMLQDIGYNVITCNHDIHATGNSASPDLWNWLDESGMGIVLNPGSFATISNYDWENLDAFATDAKEQQVYREFIGSWHRANRNHPALFACYVTQMIVCDTGNFPPNVLAQQRYPGGRPTKGKHRAIDVACDINRGYNPNILYYSHADGSNGDLSSGNLYLNWTPLQEREEWLSQWAEKGTYPWHSAEFGQPYDGSWYNCRGEMGLSKYGAIYFGDKSYEWEPEFALTNSVKACSDNRSGHGSDLGQRIAAVHPSYWELQRLWTRNTNRAWRGFGHGGGNIYFNLTHAYGAVPKTAAWQKGLRYGEMTESNYLHAASWRNPGYDIYQQANHDLCAFIGGWPVHTDKTHAYYSGEKIRKQYVVIWDGAVTTNVMGRTLRTGDIAKIPFEWTAAEVTEKTTCRKAFGDDVFEYEVYPKAAVNAGIGEVALLDPAGEGAEVLDGLGVAYRRVDSAVGVKDALVVGPCALDTAMLEVDPADVAAGLRVLVMNQKPEAWEALGFKVMDTVPRRFFTHFPELGLADDALHHWRGAPTCGDSEFGGLMPHQAPRGPRWRYTHALALFALQIPDQVGFTPLVEGEFDLGYTAALHLRAGKGSVTFTSFEFKNRIPADPAATATARALFKAALSGIGGGQPATAVAQDALKAKVAAALALPAGRPVHRADYTALKASREPLFRGMGPNLFRWPNPITNEVPERCSRFWSRVKTNAGWEPDGLVLARCLNLIGSDESSPLPALHVMGPYNLRGWKIPVRIGKDKAGNDRFDMRRLEDWRRSGDFLKAKFDPVESMAINGDYNPNTDYPLPQGGTANWRPTLLADEDGRFDFSRLFATNGFQMCYSVCEVERKAAGKAKLRLGFDWAGKMWVNGQLVFQTWDGALRPQFELMVDLKAGRNVFAFKTLSDKAGGHAVWGWLEKESRSGITKASREVTSRSLYGERLWVNDPYSYYYW